MSWKAGVLSIALSLGATAGAYAQESIPQDAQDPTIVHGCNYGEVIDSSTPEQAKAKIEAAGYSAVIVRSKGCDNVWHATGIYGGVRSNVALIPDGQVKPDGN